MRPARGGTWFDRALDSTWFDLVNATLLVAAVTVAGIAALIRQTNVFVIAILWIWTVCAISIGYSLGWKRERRRHSP